MTVTSSRPLDWRSIPDIQKDIAQLDALKGRPELPFGDKGPMAVDVGRELTLSVVVTDPELAQVVLSRAFAGDENQRIPGMVINNIGLFPEATRNRDIASYLRNLADKVEQEGHAQ